MLSQTAMGFYGFLDQGFHVPCLRYIRFNEDGLAASVLDQSHRLFTAFHIDIGNNNPAPSHSNDKAVARPIPEAPPVTNETLPCITI